MKTIAGLVLIFCALLARPMAGSAADNLLRNGGFEEGAAPWSLPPTYHVTTDAAHGGKASLKVENTDPQKYLLATQAFPFKPGMQYRFGAWIKTQNVSGEESGATLCIEWSGKKGWLGGGYVPGHKGDRDWFHLSGVTPPIPADATQIHLALYLRQEMTGTAWFDDVTVEAFYPPALDAALVRPNYRGRLTAESADQTAIVRARIGHPLQGGLTPEQTTLACSLAQGGKTLLEKKEAPAAAGDREIALDTRGLPPGEYEIRLELRSPGGKPLGQKEFSLSKLAPGAPRPTVYIDDHNRTIVDGKPFFPLGWYLSNGAADKNFPQHLERLAASPFNTVMIYGINNGGFDKARATLDALAARNIKLIYSVKDIYAGSENYQEPIHGLRGDDTIVRAIVSKFKDHPALLGWYLNDELPLAMRDRLDARQRLVRGLDPNHPTWAVLYQVDEFFGYLNSADVLGADPYPIPDKPAALAGEWTRKCAAVSGGRLPLWMVPQAFDWSNYKDVKVGQYRPPTLDEELVMSYLCLINGARGLIYYSFYDLLRDKASGEQRWADMVVVGNEMRRLFPALLSAAPAPKLEVKIEGSGVETATRADDAGNIYLLMANPGAQPATVRVAAPAGALLELLRHATSETLTAPEGVCSVKLAPLGAATLIVRKAHP